MSDSSLVSCLSEASGVKFSWVEVLLGRSQIFLEKSGKHRPIEGLEVMWFVHRAGSFSEVPGESPGCATCPSEFLGSGSKTLRPRFSIRIPGARYE